MSRRLILRLCAVGVLAASSALCPLAGCGGSELGGRSNRGSEARLAAMPVESHVLLSLHGGRLPADLLDLGEGGREIGSHGDAFLVVAHRRAVPRLAGIKGVERVLVWGRGEHVTRLDPVLRNEMLARFGSVSECEPLRVVATFAPGALDPADELARLGARIGDASGNVMTLEAPPGVLLEILNRRDLMMLESPTDLLPTMMGEQEEAR